jgi:hypothetical protein
MCQSIILHHSEKGFVVKCLSCNHYQVAFGTVAMRLSEPEFDNLLDYVDNFIVHDKTCVIKNIYIPLPSDTIQLLISLAELSNLQELLTDAKDTLSLQEMLSKLNINLN